MNTDADVDKVPHNVDDVCAHGLPRSATPQAAAPVRIAPESSPVMSLPHPRFALFLIIFVAGSVLALIGLTSDEAVILGFDLGALGFLFSAVPLWREQDAALARARAARDDGGRILLVLTAALVSRHKKTHQNRKCTGQSRSKMDIRSHLINTDTLDL